MLALGAAMGVAAAFPLARASLEQPPAPVVSDDVRQLDLLNQSVALLQSGHPEQALPLLVQADSIAYKNEMVQNNLCVAFILLRRYEDAIDACKIALVLKPDFTLAQNNLRWAHAELGKATPSP